MFIEHISAEASMLVTSDDTARHAMGADEGFPEVLATSRMVALMELAAARTMQPLLRDGQHSVNVSLYVRQVAATPVGGRVRAVATWARTVSKLMYFRVRAFDDAGLIGEGELALAVIDQSRPACGAPCRRPPVSGMTSLQGMQ